MHRSHAHTCDCSSHDNYFKTVSTNPPMKRLIMKIQFLNLLFLNDFSHFVMESHLHVNIELLDAGKENASTFAISTPHSLDAATALNDGLEVPFNFEHTPVLLYVNCSISLLLAILFSLTIHAKYFDMLKLILLECGIVGLKHVELLELLLF